MKLMLFALLMTLFFLPFSIALLDVSFSVQVNSPTFVNVYEGNPIQNKFSATIHNNGDTCPIQCSYTTTFNTHGEGITAAPSQDSTQFSFETTAIGNNGIATYYLTVTCDRIPSWNCWSSPVPLQKGPYSFSFLHVGDGTCTTEREKCDNYYDGITNFLKDNACSCPLTKECKPNGNRNPDSQGCQNYCGNKICEKNEGETCVGSASGGCGDCKKCDLSTCITGNECEGGYCVHEKCWNKPYKESDGFCDLNQGENCKSSSADCTCKTSERCSSNGMCETWCGNEFCEASEIGTCKEDCSWCGDGECKKGETCSSCSSDCGACKNEEVVKEATEKAQETVQKSIEEVKTKQKNVTLWAGGAIAVVIIGYIIFKIIQHSKSKEKSGKKKSKISKKKKK